MTANSRQKEILRQQILSDTIFIQSLGRNCPGHLPYLATYLQYKYKAAPQPSYSDPWQQAIYDYIISRPNKNNGFILIYDSEELMASAEIIERIAKDAGFTVQNLCIKEANGHYLLKLTKK